jgi:hypothetical protein
VCEKHETVVRSHSLIAIILCRDPPNLKTSRCGSHVSVIRIAGIRPRQSLCRGFSLRQMTGDCVRTAWSFAVRRRHRRPKRDPGSWPGKSHWRTSVSMRLRQPAACLHVTQWERGRQLGWPERNPAAPRLSLKEAAPTGDQQFDSLSRRTRLRCVAAQL